MPIDWQSLTRDAGYEIAHDGESGGGRSGGDAVVGPDDRPRHPGESRGPCERDGVDSGLRRDDDHGVVRVRLTGDREQILFVEPAEDGESLHVWSVVARPALVRLAQDRSGFESPHLVAWTRNRSSDLVGFKLDSRGRLVGEAWIPSAGLDADEWRSWLHAVATGCDRLEYLLSGKDRH